MTENPNVCGEIDVAKYITNINVILDPSVSTSSAAN
jgi:hypothetical protein